MVEMQWPYNLPIWRSRHQATSPDGRLLAKIDPAYEVSMGNPTAGVLIVGSQLEIRTCNPSFIWSDNSRYLAVPQFFMRWGLLRKQRLLVVDLERRLVSASIEKAWYFQPESFRDGHLVVIANPFREKRTVEYLIPADISNRFSTHYRGIVWRDAATG